METRLNDRLEASGARPTDPKDIKKLDQAKDFKSKADRLEAEGKSGAAAAARKNADKFAVDAGLTISLDKLERLETRLTRTQDRQVKVAERLSNTTERIEVLGERLVTLQERKEVLTERLETTIERLDHLSSEKLNEVVRTRTETVEREVQTEVAQETNVGFDDLVGLVQKKLADGDTEGAKAVVAEARARIERVQGQLGQIDSALGRRSGFLGDVSDRIQKSIRVNVDENLDDTSAARRAAQILSELAKNARLFSGDNAEPGILELFKGIGSNSGESDDGGSAGVVTEVEFEEVAVGASVENSRTGSSSSGDIQPFRSGPTLGGGFRL